MQKRKRAIFGVRADLNMTDEEEPLHHSEKENENDQDDDCLDD